MSDATKRQAKPIETNKSQDVLKSLRTLVPPTVFRFLEERAVSGEKKYGTRLKTFNGRDSILDLKQEVADAIMYSRQVDLEGCGDGTARVMVHEFVKLFNGIEAMYRQRQQQ